MTLRLGEPERLQPIGAAAWQRHCAQLERRAGNMRASVEQARLHHQRGFVLAEMMGDPARATTAWKAALVSFPGHLPSMLALRDQALDAGDQSLLETLSDVHLPALAAADGADARDIAEVAGLFALVWLFRWPDAERAARALARVEEAGDPLGLGARLSHLCLDEEQSIARWRERVDRLDPDAQAPVLAELGRRLIDDPEAAAEGWRLLAEAAERDPVAAWYRVEQALVMGESATLARALEHLASLSPGVGSAILLFLAAEIHELLLGDGERAEALYGQVTGGGLRAVIAVKRIIIDARQFIDDPLALSATLSEQAENVGDARLEAVLHLRAAQLAQIANDQDRASTGARLALERWPEDDRARHLVESTLWRDTRWAALGERLAEDARPELARILRAALLEHAQNKPASALGAMGKLSGQTPELLQLRTRQRLSQHMVTGDDLREAEARVRAWQHEANLLQDGDRRADLYLSVALFYLAHTHQHEKALTYLFWVLDQDPDHLTALRVIEHCCRETGRQGPLVQALEHMVELIDRPAERFEMRIELAEVQTAIGAPPERLIELYRAALNEEPSDRETQEALERLYLETGQHGALKGLYEEMLRAADGPRSRADIAVRFGPFLVDVIDDPVAALRLYDKVMPDAPPGPVRSRLDMLQTEAAAAGGLSGSLPALHPDALAALDESSMEFDFALDDIDELLTVVSDPIASRPPTEELPPLPPLLPMAPTEVETGVTGGRIEDDTAPADPPSRPGLLDSGRAAVPPPLLLADDDIEFEFEIDDADDDLDGSVELMPADVEAMNLPPAPIADRTTGFLGEERARDARRDPARAAIARKLKRSRGHAPAQVFPDFDDSELIEAVRAFDSAGDVDGKVAAAARMAHRYEAIGRPVEAIEAWRTVSGFRAGDANAVERLEALYRATEDWKGLVDILGGEATRTGDPVRRQGLLLEVARLEWRALDDPGAAVGHFLEALDLGPVDRATIAELAGAVRAVKRWRAYVDALARGGLDDPATMGPEESMDLGRVHLYELQDASRAVPYLVRAARDLPERVDIAADLAEARAALGQVDRAVALLERAIHAAVDLEPAARNVLRLRLARLYEEHAADPAAALRVYRDALGEGLGDPAVLDRIEHLAIAVEDWNVLADVLARNLDDARGRGAEADEVRPLAIRLGQLLLKRLERPRDAANAFVEAFVLDPADESIFRLVEGILRKHPDPTLQARMYAAWLGHGERALKEQLEMSLKLVAAYEADSRLDAAAEVLEGLRTRMPGDAQLLAGLERVYQKANRWDELVMIYHSALDTAIDPETRGRQLRRLARAYEVGLRDLAKATEVYRILIDDQPDDMAALKALARLLEAQKRWPELLEVSAAELERTQKPRQKAFIHFRMGSLYESQLRDRHSASAQYTAALELDPRCFPALHGLRELAASSGDWQTVVDFLGRELALWDEPKEQAAVLARMGELYVEHLDDRRQAHAHFTRALEVHPECVPAARALAETAWQADDWEAAAPHLQVLTNQNLEKLPRATCSELFYRRGVVARHLGRQLEAIESLKLALEFDADHAGALHALIETSAGEASDEHGLSVLLTRLEETRAEHLEAGELDEVARIDVLRGVAAEQQMQLDAAEAAYRQAVEQCPRDPAMVRPLVELHLKRRRWADATAVLRAFGDGLIDEAGEDGEVARQWIDALVWEGEIWSDMAVDPPRAIACYALVLAIDPENREARYRTAQCHYLMGVFDEAEAIITSLLSETDLPPDERARYTFYQGRIAEVGHRDEIRARARYTDALAVDALCAEALLALGRLMLDDDEPGAVVDLLREHQALVEAPYEDDPNAASLKTFAAGVWHRHGQTGVALRLLTPLAESGTAGTRDARFALARVHEDRGDVQAAARELERCIEDDICDIAALRALADLRTRQGDDERAFHVLSVLELYGALTPDERLRHGALLDRNRKQRDRGGRTVSDGALEADLAHRSFQSPLVALMALCADADWSPRTRPTLRRAEQVNGQRHTFTLELEGVQTLLGFKGFDLYFIGDHPELVGIWSGEPPLLVLGAPALGERCTTAERRFLVGRAAFYSKADLTPLHDAGAERALEFIGRVGGLVARSAEFDRAREPLLADLADERVNAVRGVLDRLGPSPTLPAAWTGESVLTGISHTADRAGLLAGGHLRAAVEMLTRHAGAGENIERGDDLAWAVRSGSRLRDLVKYALSDAYHRLRQAAGLSIS